MCSGVCNVYCFVSFVLLYVVFYIYWSGYMFLRWGSILVDVWIGKLKVLWMCCINVEVLSWFWGLWLFFCNKFSYVF